MHNQMCSLWVGRSRCERREGHRPRTARRAVPTILLIILASAIFVSAAPLNVVTTTPDLAAIARAIGGEQVTVRSLARVGEDPHFVEPKPSYIVALNRADVLIEVGMELEIGWLPALLDQTRNARIRPGAPGRVDASVGIRPLEVPRGPVDRSQGDVHALGNPHYLLDPERGKLVAHTIADALARVDEGNAEAYRANLAAFHQHVDECLAECQRNLEASRGQKVFGYHKSLSYFVERFGLEQVNTIEPKPGIPPSPAHITALIQQAKQENVRGILMENWYDRRVPDLIAAQTDAKVVPITIVSDKEYCAFLRELTGKVAAGLQP